jgi:hypothetical protein
VEAQAVDEWARELAGLSGADIARGLEEWVDDWPPSAPEFRRACLPDRIPECHKPFKTLPAPKASEETVRANIDKMRKLLDAATIPKYGELPKEEPTIDDPIYRLATCAKWVD